MSSEVAELERAMDVMPVDWHEVSVADAVAMLPGFAFKSENFVADADAGLPLIRIRDLGQANTATRYVGDYDETFAVRDGDILVGMDGAFEAVRWRGGKALLNQRSSQAVVCTAICDGRRIFVLSSAASPCRA